MVERLEITSTKTNYVYWIFLMYREFAKNLGCCSNPRGWLPSLPNRRALNIRLNELDLFLRPEFLNSST